MIFANACNGCGARVRVDSVKATAITRVDGMDCVSTVEVDEHAMARWECPNPDCGRRAARVARSARKSRAIR